MHSGRCPRDVEDELPEALSTINIKKTSKENNTRSLGARRVCYLLFVVGCLFVLLLLVRVQWLLNYAVMQLSFVVVVVLVIVLSTLITSNTNKNKYD